MLTQERNCLHVQIVRFSLVLKSESSQNILKMGIAKGPTSIGSYKILRQLGKGGMGEVFLAVDPVCRRQVALKRIRPAMKSNANLRRRFLQEAQIASQLAHPVVIPVYTIHETEEDLFYTMPYVEGETLKELLRSSQGDTIPTLMRVFLSICQGMAYAHARGILHRDLKPENVMVGKFGEVFILDWGLAIAENKEKPLGLGKKKIPGTLAYLAPERLQGAPSTKRTDIYALGVILYQILTLRLPFRRSSLEMARKQLAREIIPLPQEVAPYRDIPPQLTALVQRALHPNPEERFETIDSMIGEIESYIEGRPEWIPAASLDSECVSDWEFRENIFLAKHLAITWQSGVMEWVTMMISAKSFSGNTRILAQVTLRQEGNGIGFLIGIPEAEARRGLDEGYCLWLGSAMKPGCKLFRSHVEILHLPDLFLASGQEYRICIEKVDHHLRFYLNGILQFNYVSYIPVMGTHVGLLYRDGDFSLSKIAVDVGSQNIMVNCLSVPDAFLAAKSYQKALSEYRRIGHAFTGRIESREAIFRAGITLLEEARSTKNKEKKSQLRTQALDEFGQLHRTPGAPLEYLGKSLVYQAEKDTEEEIKCLELCVRKYREHPLMKVVGEHITLRLHETASKERLAAYQFALLAIRYLPHVFQSEDGQHLLEHLQKNLEPLPFVSKKEHLAIQLAFWLAKPLVLVDLIEQSEDPEVQADGLHCLLHLGCEEWVWSLLHHLPNDAEKETLKMVLEGKPVFSQRGLYALLRKTKSCKELPQIIVFIQDSPIKIYLHAEIARLYLLDGKWDEARVYLDERLNSPLFPLMGCWLWHQKGEAAGMKHFSSASSNPYPPTTALLGSVIEGKIDEKKWLSQAFFWEKLALERDLDLFYHCAKPVKEGKWDFPSLKESIKSHGRLDRSP